MHKSWISLHNAGTSTPISASLLRRVFRLHLLPMPAFIVSLFFVGEEFRFFAPLFSIVLVFASLNSVAMVSRRASLATPSCGVDNRPAEVVSG